MTGQVRAPAASVPGGRSARAHMGKGEEGAKGSATCLDADKNGVSTRDRGCTRAPAAPVLSHRVALGFGASWASICLPLRSGILDPGTGAQAGSPARTACEKRILLTRASGFWVDSHMWMEVVRRVCTTDTNV